jgi:hypothetical protein
MAGLKPALYVSIASPHIVRLLNMSHHAYGPSGLQRLVMYFDSPQGLSVKANAIHAAGFYEWTEMHHGMSWRAKVLFQAHKFLLWVCPS